MPTSKANDWPLQNGDTVCIVGGGPGGASCALAIKREAEKLGKEIRVLVFEQKRFNEGRQFNQCIGVLSPPLEDILRDQLGLELPESMLRKKIEGYHLHSDRMDLACLTGIYAARYLWRRCSTSFPANGLTSRYSKVRSLPASG